MALERLYRENIYWGIAEPEAFADRNAPTAAELNNATLVFNATCALWEESTELTLGDPDSDDGLTYCSKAGTFNPTFDNPSATFTALRDKTRKSATTTGADGVFNGTFERLAWADRSYILVKRTGYASDFAFAAGQDVTLAAMRTDLPIDVVASGDNAQIQQVFLPNGWVNWNYTLLA